jgi:hypothetical protein
VPRLLDAYILPQVKGSDHCPVGIRLQMTQSRPAVCSA